MPTCRSISRNSSAELPVGWCVCATDLHAIFGQCKPHRWCRKRVHILASSEDFWCKPDARRTTMARFSLEQGFRGATTHTKMLQKTLGGTAWLSPSRGRAKPVVTHHLGRRLVHVLLPVWNSIEWFRRRWKFEHAIIFLRKYLSMNLTCESTCWQCPQGRRRG